MSGSGRLCKAAACVRRLAPGLGLTGIVALTIQFVAPVFHAPPPLLAVLAGLAASMTPGVAAWRPGLTAASKSGLRLGVALMGAQMSWGELSTLGASSLLAAAGIVCIGLSVGTGLGMALGMPLAEAAIAAGAVSICGASAALAVAQVAKPSAALTRHTARVVIGVNILSTLAMLTYPLLVRRLGFSDDQAGLFFGLSIHDVAQVTGAGTAISAPAANAAALTKMSRIIWLGPAVMALGFAFTKAKIGLQTDHPTRRLQPPALFILGFAGLAGLRGLGLIPVAALPALAVASRLLTLGGVFAISAALDPRTLARTPLPLIGVLALGTVLVAALSLLAVYLIH